LIFAINKVVWAQNIMLEKENDAKL